MGSVVRPAARANLLAGKTALRPDEKGGGGGKNRPVHLVAGFWHEKPERAVHSQDSGLSTAIWGSRSDATCEHRRPAFDFHVLTVRLQHIRAERWYDGCPVHELDTQPGSSALTFAGVAPRSVIYGAWRSLQVYLPIALLTETAQQADLAPLRIERVQPGCAYDPILHAIGSNIVAEIERDQPGSRLQLDSLATMICVHLLRRAGSVSPAKRDAGGLARWQVKRAMDCIAERFGENLTLATLAGQVGLSQYHFARAFKQSTGLTPHRYLLHCRLKHAKELLAQTDASIADIAARVGYNEATQLSRLFQAELGVSPSVYRRRSGARYVERARQHDIANPARNVSS